MVIRRAKVAELPLLLAIDGGAARDPTHPAWLRRALAERAIWVLVHAHRVVAYGVLRRSFFDRWFVESLCVSADCRRIGCGSRMMGFFEAQVSSNGEIWTSTNLSNLPMQKLLGKRGFVRRGQVTGLDRGDPEIFYVRRNR